MFERMRNDSAVTTDQGGVTVEMVLTDDETLRGKMVVQVSRSPTEVLNSGGAFVEFAPFAGERHFIAKTSIKRLRIVNVPRAALGEALRDLDGFDPYRILGIPATATWEETRTAYLALSKTYHPDRFATVDLPDEVASYLSQMARRINAAFAALEDAQQKVKRKIDKAVPIYETGTRKLPARA